MIISFNGPVFFSSRDEDQFFGWLYSLPEYKSVRGHVRTLDLEFAQPVSADTIRELVVIFRRWCISLEALFPLRSPETGTFVLWDTALQEAAAGA